MLMITLFIFVLVQGKGSNLAGSIGSKEADHRDARP